MSGFAVAVVFDFNFPKRFSPRKLRVPVPPWLYFGLVAALLRCVKSRLFVPQGNDGQLLAGEVINRHRALEQRIISCYNGDAGLRDHIIFRVLLRVVANDSTFGDMYVAVDDALDQNREQAGSFLQGSMRTSVLNSPPDLTTWPLLSQTEITK